MPLILITMPSAPLIIPLVVLVVVVSVAILLLYYFLKRAIGCPHKTSTYRTSHPNVRKSVLPSSPYEINERESTASPSSSIFFGQSGKAVLLYPALSSSASTPNQLDERNRVRFNDQPQTPHDSDNDSLTAPDSPEPNITRSDDLILMESRSASASPGRDNQESPMPYEEIQESVTYRGQVSYQRTEQSFVTFDASVEPHFESDTMLGSLRERIQSAIQYELPTGLRDLRLSETITTATAPILKASSSPSTSSSSPSSSSSSAAAAAAAALPSSSAPLSSSSVASPLLKMTLKSKVPKIGKGILFMGSDEPENESVNHSAGKEMVEHFQAKWCELQAASLQNAEKAAVVWNDVESAAKRIERTHRAFHAFVSDSSDLSVIVKALTDVDNQILKCSRLCHSLEDAITDLDKEFESIDFQMRQRETECRLKDLIHSRDEDLVVLKAQLQALHEQKIKDKALREAEISRERQRVFQEVFEEEVARYKSGTLPVKSKRNDDNGQMTKVSDSELLNIDVADEAEVAALEDFLAS